MKTKEELNALKAEVETLNKKLAELTDEELAQVSGGLELVNEPTVFEDGGLNLVSEDGSLNLVSEPVVLEPAVDPRTGHRQLGNIEYQRQKNEQRKSE